jgi:hypothetical protein
MGILLVDTQAVLEPIFAEGKRLIAVHAEDRSRIYTIVNGHVVFDRGEIISDVKGKALKFN